MLGKDIVEISVKALVENPWHFRLMYEKDFAALVENIQENGFETIASPIVAAIGGKTYIVDGHWRIKAAQEAGHKTVYCKISHQIKNLQSLRVNSFLLNKEEYSNPLLLSDMFYEDYQDSNSTIEVSKKYNVSEKYVQSLLKIRSLHDDAKSTISKILEISRKKYQFILNQITPEHLSGLIDLPQEKQAQVVDWIFRDLVYGPMDESLVSIPSIYEILEEISNINEKRTIPSKKYNSKSLSKPKEFSFTCKCGSKFDINTKSNLVFEYIEQNNMIIKKEFDYSETTQVFSSKFYSKSDLIRIIEKSDNEIRIILSKGQPK